MGHKVDITGRTIAHAVNFGPQLVAPKETARFAVDFPLPVSAYEKFHILIPTDHQRNFVAVSAKTEDHAAHTETPCARLTLEVMCVAKKPSPVMGVVHAALRSVEQTRESTS